MLILLWQAEDFPYSTRFLNNFRRCGRQLADRPLLAAILGALFVGIGVGLCVRAGGAPGGDDALAMSIHKVTNWVSVGSIWAAI